MIIIVLVKIEVHVGRESNSHIWNNIKYLYTFSTTQGKITQKTGESGTYKGVGIIIAELSDDYFIRFYPSYLMPNNP